MPRLTPVPVLRRWQTKEALPAPTLMLTRWPAESAPLLATATTKVCFGFTSEISHKFASSDLMCVMASDRVLVHYNNAATAEQGTLGTARTGSAATTSACWWTRTTTAARFPAFFEKEFETTKRASIHMRGLARKWWF
jgi:hypothetical protein